MSTLLKSRSALFTFMATVGLLASSCGVILTGGGTGSGPCYEGTWELSGSDVADLIGSIFGDLTIVADDDGLTLDLNDNGTFSFGGSQTLEVSGSTIFGNIDGTVSATATVGGTYESEALNSLTFTLDSIAGSGTFVGTVGGSPINTTMSLDQFGLDELYGLSGTIDTTCSAGTLELDLGSVVWTF